jgi:hypothetical protein
MPAPTRMPRYDVRNDGIGPYAVFYCDVCAREYRSQPNVAATVTTDIGRQALGGLLRNVPLVGRSVANSVTGEDQRYSTSLSPQQLEAAWKQVMERFRECPTCMQIVCLSDFDEQSGYCREDSPRKNEIAEAQAEQAGKMVKGFAAAFGLDKAFNQVGEAARAAQTATNQLAYCPQGHMAAPGTKFCPECGETMTQPASVNCPHCGQAVMGAKFCPNCGAKVEQVAPATCPNCGAPAKGAKFCSECGTKIA